MLASAFQHQLAAPALDALVDQVPETGENLVCWLALLPNLGVGLDKDPGRPDLGQFGEQFRWRFMGWDFIRPDGGDQITGGRTEEAAQVGATQENHTQGSTARATKTSTEEGLGEFRQAEVKALSSEVPRPLKPPATPNPPSPPARSRARTTPKDFF